MTSFGDRYDRWLNDLGFTLDPFALHEADQERDYLPYTFVDRPYFNEILGDPAHPKTTILMAGRGVGKTATREMVAHECNQSARRHRALPVRYYDFNLLLNRVDGDVTRITARDHVEHLARALFKYLSEDVPATYFDHLSASERGLLLGQASAFADPLALAKIRNLVTGDPLDLDWLSLSPLETLQALAEVVTCLGQSPTTRYKSIYFLVDRVDESSAGFEGAVPLLLPLIRERPLLELPNIAFKFFIPREVGTRLRQVIDLRPDRIFVRNITWDYEALEQVVQQRLRYHSNEIVNRLEDVCTASAKPRLMERLILQSSNSPRQLIRLCHSLFYHHVDQMRVNRSLITRQDVTTTLVDFEQQLAAEQLGTSTALNDVSVKSTIVEEAVPAQGLYLDRGHVWVDGDRVSPPLSSQEDALLRRLYSHRPNIVSKENLISAVWPVRETGNTSYDEQNLRKLVSRLRERLEPGVAGRESRFVRSARGRGYWLSVE